MIEIFSGTVKCKVTRAAQRFFADRRIQVQVVDLREKGLSKGELASVARAVGGVRALYDAEGPRAKERGGSRTWARTRRASPSSLVDDPMSLRTPIVTAHAPRWARPRRRGRRSPRPPGERGDSGLPAGPPARE